MHGTIETFAPPFTNIFLCHVFPTESCDPFTAALCGNLSVAGGSSREAFGIR